ncbi:MAG: Maf family protein [Ruminococcus sp.]|jgi:septum formation protein|nr:Maf family protein [Ruminococcus sp.]
MKTILASTSPRRLELIRLLGIEPTVISPSFDESAETVPGEITPDFLAEFLAVKKCMSVFMDYPDDVVITADTVVIYGNDILGKPAGDAEAALMLRRLSAKTHTVITGVCIGHGGHTTSFSEMTYVEFDVLPDTFIEAYIKTGSPRDKAGAYGIQDDMLKPFIKKIDGNLENVIGLPLCKLRKTLNDTKILKRNYKLDD